MIIDFHTHVFPNAIAEKTVAHLATQSNSMPYSNGTIDGLLENMTKGNVNTAVALPVLTNPLKFESVNTFAKKINDDFQNQTRRVISFAGIHPCCEDLENKMAFIKSQGFLGVKIHPDYQNAFIDDERYIRIIELAKENDLIVVTHAGVDEGFKGEPVKCPPDKVAKVIEKVNYNKLVLAHYGGNKSWNDVIKYLCGKNVFFDTSFTFNNISDETFLAILKKHGKDKILFATDLPWQDMKFTVEKLKSLGLDKQSLDAIFYKNALKLLKIGE